MKEYLSFGAGVNSTALMLILHDQGIEFETIFVNHETDYPETYEYVEYLRQQGFKITDVIPNYQGFKSLAEYCKAKRFLPSIYLRWCTYRFKLRPIWKFVEKPCIMHIGISAEEKHRISVKQPKDITGKWLLVEQGLTRQDCVKIIKRANLEIPMKSGCWLCPFQGKKQLRDLYRRHPDLFEKIVELERIRGNAHSLKAKPIQHYVSYNTAKLEPYILGNRG